MSKISQKIGQQLENYLDKLHAMYCAQGRAFLFKVPNPVKITTPVKRGVVTGRLGRAVYVDYSGTLDGGISVALEAKCTVSKGVSFPFGERLPQHQRDTLTMVHKLGGIAAVYVRRVHGMTADDYLVPAVFIDAHERKSFKWAEVEQFKVPAGKTWIDCAPSCDYDNRVNDWAAYCSDGWPQYDYNQYGN